MLDRRAFLRRLGFGTVAAAAAASGVLDIERLLWVPGEKTIFCPTTIVEPNSFVTMEWLSAETLRVLGGRLEMAAAFNRDLDRLFPDLPVVYNVPLPRRFRV